MRRSRVAAVAEPVADPEIDVASGDSYAAPSPRGPRVVAVERVTWETGTPRATAREVAPPCPHAGMRALIGTCPCPRVDGALFEVALTFDRASRRWVMPRPYERVPVLP